MKLYTITAPRRSQTIYTLLIDGARARKLTVVPLDPDSFDYTNQPQLEPGSLLYRVDTSSAAMTMESLLLRDDIVTFYKSYHRGLANHAHDRFDAILQQRAGVPMPKTIFHLTRDHERLTRYVEYLGGFPVVVKILGGSHGRGVMKVDSFSSLVSIVDYLLHQYENVIMRQFINTQTSARLIVLGDRVIDSIEYTAQGGDFRSNTSRTPTVAAKKFTPDIAATAVAAVKATEVEFGGVDILLDDQGKHYVTEVNYPCNFARAQAITGVNIVDQILEYLIAKRARR